MPSSNKQPNIEQRLQEELAKLMNRTAEKNHAGQSLWLKQMIERRKKEVHASREGDSEQQSWLKKIIERRKKLADLTAELPSPFQYLSGKSALPIHQNIPADSGQKEKVIDVITGPIKVSIGYLQYPMYGSPSKFVYVTNRGERRIVFSAENNPLAESMKPEETIDNITLSPDCTRIAFDAERTEFSAISRYKHNGQRIIVRSVFIVGIDGSNLSEICYCSCLEPKKGKETQEDNFIQFCENERISPPETASFYSPEWASDQHIRFKGRLISGRALQPYGVVDLSRTEFHAKLQPEISIQALLDERNRVLELYKLKSR